MDEHRPDLETDGVGPGDGRDRPSSVERLVGRLGELREQLELLAPHDQEQGREVLERVRRDQERIGTLEELLAGAREREQDLTAQAVRDRARILELETRVSELSVIADRVTAAEEARGAAESTADELRRAASLSDARWEAAQEEVSGLRSRTIELESDLAAVATDLAAATVARAEAARLAAERDEARERARTERRLAAQDRMRAADADLRATELQRELRAAERRIVRITNEHRATEQRDDASEGSPAPPWIELQRTSGEVREDGAPEPPSLWATPEQTSLPAENDSDVVDLTESEGHEDGSMPRPNQRRWRLLRDRRTE